LPLSLAVVAVRDSTPTLQHKLHSSDRCIARTLTLQDHFEVLVSYGYENDCGGFGDVILNMKTRQITVERNDRFEDYTPSSYEV
jgi:hypothetical protein